MPKPPIGAPLQWWVVWGAGAQTGRGAVPVNAHAIYHADSATSADSMFSASHPGYHITQTDGPFSSTKAAQDDTAGKTPTGATTHGAPDNFSFPNVGGWFTSLGGMIGSGIESGFIAIVKDLWDIIIGPIEVVWGLILALIILIYAFKDDIAQLASVVARGAV